MSVRDLQFADNLAIRPKAQAKAEDAAQGASSARLGRSVGRAATWRRKGPQAVVKAPPLNLGSVALDAVAVGLGLGIGLAVVAAISIVATF